METLRTLCLQASPRKWVRAVVPAEPCPAFLVALSTGSNSMCFTLEGQPSLPPAQTLRYLSDASDLCIFIGYLPPLKMPASYLLSLLLSDRMSAIRAPVCSTGCPDGSDSFNNTVTERKGMHLSLGQERQRPLLFIPYACKWLPSPYLMGLKRMHLPVQ